MVAMVRLEIKRFIAILFRRLVQEHLGENVGRDLPHVPDKPRRSASHRNYQSDVSLSCAFTQMFYIVSCSRNSDPR